jgi:molybdopterin converting factor small subunit
VITLLVPGALRAEAGGGSKLTLDVPDPPTLGAVLDRVAADWPRFDRRIRDEQGELRRFVNVYVDGEDCRRLAGLATPVADGCEVHVIPSVAGGS